MSQNQSRSEKSESTHLRKSGRHSGYSGQHQRILPTGKGGPTAPPTSSNRSSKKFNNAQGGQSRAGGSSVNLESNSSASAARTLQNGAHVQPPLHGSSDVAVTKVTVKHTDALTWKIIQDVPKVQSSNAATVITDTTAPATPAKGDASRSFPLQFGSISPSFMNGMQIPARTSSAPPNLDEQKCGQVRHDSSSTAPSFPTPIPKQHLPSNNAMTLEHSNSGEAPPTSFAKREVEIVAASPATHTQKPSTNSTSGISLQLPFHQPRVSIQFGAPNPQIQSQGMTATSLPTPLAIPFPMGNPAQMQQQVFVPGLQPHPMQTQGVMHQGQSLKFSSQMAHQLPTQLGNMGISITQQFPQQQAGTFGSPRKVVKITHPETHEELSFDRSPDVHVDIGSLNPRSHPNVPPQSQPILSFPPGHPINYYPNAYNSSPIFYPTPSSLPLVGIQQTPNSQAPRFYNQVTMKPAAGLHASSVTSSDVENCESPKLTRPHEEASSTYMERESENESFLSQSKSGLHLTFTMALASKQTAGVSADRPKPNSFSPVPPGAVEDSAVVSTTSAEGAIKEALNMSNSIKDEQKKPGKKGHCLLQNWVGGQSTSVLSLPCQSLEHCNSQNAGISETLEPRMISASSGTSVVVSETARELMPGTVVVSANPSDIKDDQVAKVTASVASKTFDGEIGVKKANVKKVEMERLGEILLHGGSKQKDNTLEIASRSISLQSPDDIIQTEQTLDPPEAKVEECVGSHVEDDRVTGSLVTSFSRVQDTINAETSLSSPRLSTVSQGDGTSIVAFSGNHNRSGTKKSDGAKSVILDQELASVSTSSGSEATLIHEGETSKNICSVLVSPSAVGSKNKFLLEPVRAKSCGSKAKKKRKEILQKADSAGATFDLYMAYKGPGEKETITSAESTDNNFSSCLKHVSADASQEDDISSEKPDLVKTEPDDWEDAADNSTPKLETSDNGNQVHGGLKHHREDGNEVMTKKYSRDFLLKFADHWTDLPEDFEITSDIVEVLMVSNVNGSRDLYPSSGRVIDRMTVATRHERQGSGMGGDEKWGKICGSFASEWDMQLNLGYGGDAVSFRPGQGGNYGVLKNPHAQTPIQYAGGILSGPMQLLGPQEVMQWNSLDFDRWPRATAFQKGLIPSPQTPSRMMHKAAKKYEVGKVADEEEAKQRQLKAILNKLTPQNFEKLFERVKQANIDNAVTLTGVISQIFDKALMEPTFCEMYANFCYHLAVALPDLSVDDEKITFKRLLLNKCQEEFERGEREQEEANKTDEEGKSKQSEEEREEKRIRARRRMLGNIRLIGELYKKKMLTERIMHECIKKLLGQPQNPDEEDVEALCKLMSTIGEIIDHPKAKEHMDVYFEMMASISNNMKLSSRVRFMLKDAIDLRKNKWQQRRKVEGPKKIEEVHRDAAQERQAQVGRLARAPSISSSVRRGQPVEFASRVSNILSPSSVQVSGFRRVSSQLRGYSTQDTRFEDRHSFETTTLSVPLPQSPMDDDSITLGPQGALARGMSFRGQPSMPSIPSANMPSPGNSRRITAVPNYNFRSERIAHGTYGTQERNMNYGNREMRNADHSFDQSLSTSSPSRVQGPSFTQSVPSEKVWPEERLRDMSMAGIKEFYSSKDEKKVALCIKDLNAPSFYPSMISIWVTDSFERRDMERDLLAKLLISLTKSRDIMISHDELIKGFESVLTTLEDAVNDAPRAAEYLGCIFAKVILEDVIPFTEIEQLIYEGGEEERRLVEIGLAAEVLGSMLEIIKSESGDSVLNEMCANSNLRLENFRPPGSNKSWRLEKFL